MPSPLHDSELMQLADGELDAELVAGLGTEQRAKVAAVRDLGDAVRTHLELSADEASPRLARMWDEIDKRISLDEAHRAPEPAKAAHPAVQAQGWWSRVGRWLDDHRSHVLTGVLSAGAVAAVALMLRPEQAAQPIAQAPIHAPLPSVGSGAPTQVGGGTPGQVMVRSTPPAVESLDVTGGSGSVFTIEDEDGGTAVIWVTPDDTVEGL